MSTRTAGAANLNFNRYFGEEGLDNTDGALGLRSDYRAERNTYGLNLQLVRDNTLLGELAPTSTFATGYLIHPFIGLIPAGQLWRLSPLEVDAVIELPLQRLRESHTRTRLERRGFTFETDAYIVDEHLIWGATARIIENLLLRLEAEDLDAGLSLR